MLKFIHGSYIVESQEVWRTLGKVWTQQEKVHIQRKLPNTFEKSENSFELELVVIKIINLSKSGWQ